MFKLLGLKRLSHRRWSYRAFKEFVETFSKMPETSTVLVVGTLFGEPLTTLAQVYKGTIVLVPGDALEFEDSFEGKAMYATCGEMLANGRLKFMRKSVESVLRDWVFMVDGITVDAVAFEEPEMVARALVPFVRPGGEVVVLGRRFAVETRDVVRPMTARHKEFKDALFAKRA